MTLAPGKELVDPEPFAVDEAAATPDPFTVEDVPAEASVETEAAPATVEFEAVELEGVSETVK